MDKEYRIDAIGYYPIGNRGGLNIAIDHIRVSLTDAPNYLIRIDAYDDRGEILSFDLSIDTIMELTEKLDRLVKMGG